MVARRLQVIDADTITRLWKHVIKHLFEYLVYKPL